MDKWTELRNVIKELHDNNLDRHDVAEVTRFLLKIMDVLDCRHDEKEALER